MSDTPTKHEIHIKDLSKTEIDDLLNARIDYLDFITSDSDEIKIFHIPVEKMRTGRWADPQLPLLYSFGMPQDAELGLRNMSGVRFGDKYKDFTVELFGVVGEIPPDIQRQTTPYSETGNWRSYVLDLSQIPKTEIRAGAYIGIPLDDDRVIHLQIWRTRVFMAGSNMYAEEIWHGRRRVWFRRIENIPFTPDHEATALQIKKLADALGLPSFIAQQKTISGYTEKQIEEMITETIEKMAKSEPNKSRPRRFKVNRFAAAWPEAIGRTTIYNYVASNRLARNGEIETRYKQRCAELANLE